MRSKTTTPSLQYSNTPSLLSDRKVFLGSIVSLIVFAWLVLWLWGRSPYGRYLSHEQLGEIGLDGASSLFWAITLYVAGWTLMTVAMMLPTVLPLLEIFRRLVAQRPERAQLVALLIIGYLGVWAGFGIVAHCADWVLHEVVERSSWLEANAWVIGVGTLLVVGGLQFSRMKSAGVEKGGGPWRFVMEPRSGRNEDSNGYEFEIH